MGGTKNAYRILVDKIRAILKEEETERVYVTQNTDQRCASVKKCTET